MKIKKTNKDETCSLVWMKKGEDFPGTSLGGQKQGYHLLWTGSNLSDFRGSEYLGTNSPSEEYLIFRGIE